MADNNKLYYNDEVGLEYVIYRLKEAIENGWVKKDGDKVLSDVNFSTEYKEALDDLIENALVVIDDAISKDSENAVQNKVIATELEKYAKLEGATFTGAVKLPTAAEGTNDTTAASTAFVTAAITKALVGISGIEIKGGYTSYEDLVEKETEPSKGIIYLVTKASATIPNASDEYFWNGTNFELFGTTAVNLDGYIRNEDLVAITTKQIDDWMVAAGFDINVTEAPRG